mmetsp:Transcript_46548/g.129658  ORF Transcript_46548/g.129658 Transcript_46548/m.129658 type:complete len:478 (+) Transcript_46548:1518-2951(+)
MGAAAALQRHWQAPLARRARLLEHPLRLTDEAVLRARGAVVHLGAVLQRVHQVAAHSVELLDQAAVAGLRGGLRAALATLPRGVLALCLLDGKPRLAPALHAELLVALRTVLGPGVVVAGAVHAVLLPPPLLQPELLRLGAGLGRLRPLAERHAVPASLLLVQVPVRPAAQIGGRPGLIGLRPLLGQRHRELVAVLGAVARLRGLGHGAGSLERSQAVDSLEGLLARLHGLRLRHHLVNLVLDVLVASHPEALRSRCLPVELHRPRSRAPWQVPEPPGLPPRLLGRVLIAGHDAPLVALGPAHERLDPAAGDGVAQNPPRGLRDLARVRQHAAVVAGHALQARGEPQQRALRGLSRCVAAGSLLGGRLALLGEQSGALLLDVCLAVECPAGLPGSCGRLMQQGLLLSQQRRMALQLLRHGSLRGPQLAQDLVGAGLLREGRRAPAVGRGGRQQEHQGGEAPRHRHSGAEVPFAGACL